MAALSKSMSVYVPLYAREVMWINRNLYRQVNIETFIFLWERKDTFTPLLILGLSPCAIERLNSSSQVKGVNLYL